MWTHSQSVLTFVCLSLGYCSDNRVFLSIKCPLIIIREWFHHSIWFFLETREDKWRNKILQIILGDKCYLHQFHYTIFSLLVETPRTAPCLWCFFQSDEITKISFDAWWFPWSVVWRHPNCWPITLMKPSICSVEQFARCALHCRRHRGHQGEWMNVYYNKSDT